MTPVEVFTLALRACRKRHGNIFPAATVEAFAFKRWERLLAANPEAQSHPSFAAEGQKACEFFLLDEVLLFEKAKKST